MASTNETLMTRSWRVAKTIFFITNMLASLLLVCAPPLLVVLVDILLPSTLLAAINGPGFSSPSFTSQVRTFRFRDSLVDLPLVSLTRSLLILCSYLCCNAWEPYLGVTAVCAGASAGYVLVKAIAKFWPDPIFRVSEGSTVEALFLTSLALGMAHVVVAYRTSCRERRKLVVYKIDVEAVSLYNIDFHNYHKITLSK